METPEILLRERDHCHTGWGNRDVQIKPALFGKRAHTAGDGTRLAWQAPLSGI
jgi:hypothetical protein